MGRRETSASRGAPLRERGREGATREGWRCATSAGSPGTWGLWTGADNHEIAPEVWLLAADGGVDPRWAEAARTAFPDLDLKVFAEGGSPGAGAVPVRALGEMAFVRRVAPTVALRLSDDPAFDIFVEWCAANGVPVRDYAGHVRSATGELGVRPGGAQVFTRLSDFARPAHPSSEAQSPVASWSASGWESLADLINRPEARAAG